MEPDQWANRLGEKEGQIAMCIMGFGGGQKVSFKCHQTGGLKTKIALLQASRYMLRSLKLIESQRKDLPGPRSLRFSGKCRGGGSRDLCEGARTNP